MRLLPLLVIPVLLLAGCAPTGLGPVDMLSDGTTTCLPGVDEGDFAVPLKNHGPVAVTLDSLDFGVLSAAKVASATVDGEPVENYVLKGNGEVSIAVHLTGPGYVANPSLVYTDADHQTFTTTANQTLGFGTAPTTDAVTCN